MDVTVEIVGWTAAVLVTVAYGLVTTRRLTSAGTAFHVLNLAGAAGLLANAAFHGALPSVALNAVWALIAIRGLTRPRRPDEVAKPPGS